MVSRLGNTTRPAVLRAIALTLLLACAFACADAVAAAKPAARDLRTTATANSIAISWKAPTGGVAVTGYRVEYRLGGGVKRWRSTKTIAARTRNTKLTKLAPSSSYKLRVRVRAGKRWAAPGRVITVRTLASAGKLPSAPAPQQPDPTGPTGPVEPPPDPEPTGTLPLLTIDTDGGVPVVSKDDYVNASFDLAPNTSGFSALSGTTEIKGRGNSTWNEPKKPYRLKFTTKAPVMGMPSSKHWVLLANYYDPTHMRNALAGWLGAQTGLAWTPKGEFVELELNGDYVGLYYLTQQVRVDSDRVNVTAMKDTDIAEPNVTGGYLLELDGRRDGEHIFDTGWGPIIVKEPEAAVSQQLTYIEDYVESFEDALYGPSFTDPTEGYAKYIDVNSWIDWYLVSEFTKNNDSMWSSTFMYKPRNGKLFIGPLWDFDLSLGRGWDYHPPEGWLVRHSDGDVDVDKYSMFERLFDDPAFAAAVAARWQALKSGFAQIGDEIDDLSAEIAPAAAADAALWPHDGFGGGDPGYVWNTFAAEVPLIKEWLETRHGWIDSQFD